jgi:hypothetical protein
VLIHSVADVTLCVSGGTPLVRYPVLMLCRFSRGGGWYPLKRGGRQSTYVRMLRCPSL